MDVVIIGAAGTGKDSVFDALENLDPHYMRFAFADGVRRFLEAQFPDQFPAGGIQWDKAKRRPEIRKLLQDTGMAGRAVNPRMWIEVLEQNVRTYTTAVDRVVVTDARMHNELDLLVVGWNSVLVYIDRPGVEQGEDWREHASEQEWRSWIDSAHMTFTGPTWTPESVAAAIHAYVIDKESK